MPRDFIFNTLYDSDANVFVSTDMKYWWIYCLMNIEPTKKIYKQEQISFD